MKLLGFRRLNRNECLLFNYMLGKTFSSCLRPGLAAASSKSSGWMCKADDQGERHVENAVLNLWSREPQILSGTQDTGICFRAIPFAADLYSEDDYPSKMHTPKPAPTPLPFAHHLYEDKTPTTQDERENTKRFPIVKCLDNSSICTQTRPECATAVPMLGKYQFDCAVRHWKALKNFARYFGGTQRQEVLLPSTSSDVKLEPWCDADWVRDRCQRRPRTGHCLLLPGNPVIWTSKVQTSTALSISESEFTALSSCTGEVSRIRDRLIAQQATQSSRKILTRAISV